MKIHEIKTVQFVPRTIDRVFDFFKKPENLAELTPSSLGFQILSPSPIQMEKGRLIDYTIKVMGVRQRWRTLISEYDPPFRFVDEQLSGPYSFWHHTHIFEPVEGGTNITDHVRYVMPFGPLGEMVHSIFVRNQLENIFIHRKHIIDKVFGE